MPTCLPRASRATAVTLAPAAEETCSDNEFVVRSGVILTSSTALSGTGSIHTVCQMPDDGV